MAARAAGVPEDAVVVHVTYLGGGFGRRLEVDVVGQAVRIALETGGRPVQLIWSREEDMTHDFYRPAGGRGAAREPRRRRAAAGARDHQRRRRDHAALARARPARCSPARSTRPTRPPAKACSTCRTRIAHQRIAHVATRHAMPIGFWRSVGHSQHAFFSESFIDELAHDGRADPVAYRLALLKGMPRHQAVLELAAEQAGWPGYGDAAAAGGARARHRAARKLRQHRRAGRRGLAGRRASARPPRGLRGRRRHASSTRASSRSRWKAR